MKRFFFLLCSLTPALSLAQPASPPPAPAGEAKPAEKAEGAPKGDEGLKFEQGEKLSDKEKIARSSAEIQKMRETLKIVLGKLEEARNAKDVVKLNCVNEKLTQIKGFIRIAEQADVALQEAVAKQEPGTADHEFTKIEIASQRVAQLRADAEACIGQGAYSAENGPTQVEVTTPADLPSTDTAAAPPAPPAVTTPPPASPVQ